MKVIVEAVSESNLDPDNCAGIYILEVEENYNQEYLANIALDVFHISIPIKNLEDYNMSVKKESGELILESPDSDSYKFCSLGRIVEFIPNEIISLGNKP
jgi:hypothetical protein